MVDLSSFSDTCAYCYNGVKEGLSVCNCNISLCEDHKDLHFNKTGCSTLYTLSLDQNHRIIVDAPFEKQELEERINIKIKNGMNSFMVSKECLHVYESKNIEKKIEKLDIKCEHCDIKENIWICLDCGHMGCGREQEGMVGRGHAIKHFKDTGHSQSVLSSSIFEGQGDTFCYCCDDFITNPFNIQIEIKNNDAKTFEDLTGIKNVIPIPSNIIGFVNEGLTCYISSVLHLICEVLKNLDLSDHFLICESNPMNCICCQLIKIINEARKIENTMKSVRIIGFLKCFFNDKPEFSFKKQEDSSEFLYCLLEILKNYESCMLFPQFSHLIENSVTEFFECKKCHKSRSECSKFNIFYIPFKDSLQNSFSEYFSECSTPCECGGLLERRAYFTCVPKFIIAALGRHKFENGNYIKVEDDINIDSFKVISKENSLIKNYNLMVKGAIIHRGKETISGHYLWWMEDNNEYFVANDDIISKSDEKYPRQGNLFLIKSKEYSQ